MMLADMLALRLQYRDVALLRNEHKSEQYRKINPMGTVPALQDGDFILSESHAILKYLLSSYGGSHRERLYPSEAKARALVDQCLFFNAGYLFPKMGSLMLPTLIRGEPEPSPERLKDEVDEAFGIIEAYLQSRRFLAADRLTLADLSVGATATATLLLRKLDKDRFPRVSEWIQELEEMPCFKIINAEGLAYLKKAMHKAREMRQSKKQSQN